MMIGVWSTTALADRALRARPVDDPPAADGRSRRGQRRDLGPPRPPAAGAGRPGAPARQRRLAAPGHRDDRQRAAGVAADLPRRVDAGHRRLHRRPQPAPERPARLALRQAGRPRAGPDRGQLRSSWATSRRSSRTTSRSSATPSCRGGERGNGLMLVVEKLRARARWTSRAGSTTPSRSCGRAWRGVRMDTTVFRPASYVHSAIDHLALAFAIAGALVLLALAAFLLRWRTVLVSAVAIGLSLVTAALVLDLTEATINLLVIAGLAVAIGVVVDDAAGDVQDIERRLEGRPWSRTARRPPGRSSPRRCSAGAAWGSRRSSCSWRLRRCSSSAASTARSSTRWRSPTSWPCSRRCSWR